MNKQKTQECIDLLNDQIDLEDQEEYSEEGEDYRESQIRIFNFREIIDSLEKQEKLIDDFVGLTKKYQDLKDSLFILCKLLPSQQPKDRDGLEKSPCCQDKMKITTFTQSRRIHSGDKICMSCNKIIETWDREKEVWRKK